jgi:DNA polymerase III delta prime subunit
VSGILGHAAVFGRLRDAAAADRLPHALLFSGPEGVGKRTVATAFARELIAGEDSEQRARFDRGAHASFLLYSDLEKPRPIRRGDLLEPERDESALLAGYEILQNEGWISGVATQASGADVIDLIVRNPDNFLGRKGIPFADVLERSLASLQRSRKSTADAVGIARRLFSPGTSTALYRRNLGIELINGKGDGEYFRNVGTILRTASGGGWRVVVVDDAHKMTDAAENAFLKTLEEPPPSTLLILITSEPLSLLSTTRSRCARVVFDSITAEDLGRFLGTQGVAASRIPPIVALAGGSVGAALDLRGLDLESRTRFVGEILPAIAAGDLGKVLGLSGRRLSEEAAGAETRDALRVEARILLELLALAFRDLVVASAVAQAPAISGLDPSRIRELAALLPPRTWEGLFERTEIALSDLDAHVEPRLAVEALFAEALPVGALG